MKWFCAVLTLLATAYSCHQHRFSSTPNQNGSIIDIITARFRWQEGEKSQNGRIIVSFSANNSRLLFLNSVNQTMAELWAEDNQVLLLNRRAKTRWQGDFSTLLQKYWGIQFTLSEWRELFMKGIIPKNVSQERGMTVSLHRDAQTTLIDEVDVVTGQVMLSMRILHRKSKIGSINFIDLYRHYRSVAIEEIFENG